MANLSLQTYRRRKPAILRYSSWEALPHIAGSPPAALDSGHVDQTPGIIVREPQLAY
jgi:hypothetical protein